MPKPRRRHPRDPVAEMARAWSRACVSMDVLCDRQHPLFRLEPLLAAHVLAMSGRDRDAMSDAVHDALEAGVRHWHDLQTGFHMKPPKPPTLMRPIGDLPLRARLGANQEVLIEVASPAGHLTADELVLLEVLPDTMINGCRGVTLEKLLGPGDGLYDDTRTVTSGHVRFSTQTIFRLSPTDKIDITYRQLFGDPSRRHRDQSIPVSLRQTAAG